MKITKVFVPGQGLVPGMEPCFVPGCLCTVPCFIASAIACAFHVLREGRVGTNPRITKNSPLLQRMDMRFVGGAQRRTSAHTQWWRVDKNTTYICICIYIITLILVVPDIASIKPFYANKHTPTFIYIYMIIHPINYVNGYT